MRQVSLTIPGKPQGKARPRATRRGNMYTPKDTVCYENLIVALYKQEYDKMAFNSDAQLKLDVTAYYQIPKSMTKKE